MAKPSIEVEIQNDIIMSVMRGAVNGAIVSEFEQLLAAAIKKQYAAGKKALVMIDISGIEKEDSSARIAAKRVLDLRYDRMAVYGAHGAIGNVANFLIKPVSLVRPLRYFATQRQAAQWLNGNFETTRLHTRVGRAILLLAIAAAAGVLWGWYTDNETLKRVIPVSVTMNPVTATNFILLSVAGLLLTWAARPRWATRTARAASLAVIIIGVLVLLRYFTGFESYVDRILFSEAVEAQTPKPSRIAPNTAFNFAVVGALMTLASWRRRGRNLKRLEYSLLTLSSCSLVITLTGYVYDIPVLYQISYFIPMAVHTATLFVLMLAFLVAHRTDWTVHRWFARVPRSLWMGASIFLAVQILTGFTWQQTQARIDARADKQSEEEFEKVADSLGQKLRAYNDTLYGYRALYAASSSVTRDDFQRYLQGASLLTNYPGITAISFIERVPADQKSAYEARVRSDRSLPALDLSQVRIRPQTNKPEYFAVTYIEPQPATASSIGFDISSDEARRQNLERARATTKPSGSGTINLNAATGGKPERYGFFMTLPMYSSVQPKNETLVGFVNVVFDYKQLFGDALGTPTEGLQVNVYDEIGNKPLYSSGSVEREGARVRSVVAEAAGRPWRIELVSAKNYGLTATEARSHYWVLGLGTFLSLIVAGVVVVIGRRREDALLLAEKITYDLQAERNSAVGNYRRTQAILSSIGDAVFAVDPKGVIILFNPMAEQISGYSVDEALGKHYSDVLDFRFEKNNKPNTSFITKALSGKHAKMANHTVIVHKEGNRTPVADSAAPILDDHDNLIGAIVVFRDVTQELAIERAKDEFVSLASHQLRTPATGVKQFLGMLREGYAGKLTSEQAEMVEDAYASNERQINIVQDMLDVARLDAGRMKLEYTKVNVGELLTAIVAEQQGTIDSRKQTLKLKAPKALTNMLDANRIRMVLENLISNASKYTPEGGTITVAARKIDGKLEVVVQDSGVGIAAEDISKLFGKFSRIANPLSTKVGGSGLGLYLAKQIVQLHGGKIVVTSSPGKGSRFTVVLPLKERA